MTKRMLIDASHAEETRVVVLDGTILEEFDLEAATRRPLKGNIYLAKVVRVEPSLQAAFVEYGGNRHGFLAFSEIHPDYYQIPVADRQHLLDMQAAEAREEAEAEEAQVRAEAGVDQRAAPRRGRAPRAEAAAGPSDEAAAGDLTTAAIASDGSESERDAPDRDVADGTTDEGALDEPAVPDADPSSAGVAPLVLRSEHASVEAVPAMAAAADLAPESLAAPGEDTPADPLPADPLGSEGDRPVPLAPVQNGHSAEAWQGPDHAGTEVHATAAEGEGNARFGIDVKDAPPETLGGEGPEDSPEDGPEEGGQDRRMPSRFMRHYKIQEVIRRRQIMLIQVVKEERGTKGAALSTYVSLAGRFSVLMPNSPRGGGVSRKITSTTDRRRLREVIDELELPDGMSLIVRTAGAQRPKPEIRRDGEYLLRLWDNIRDRTLQSSAPALIYEEADLIKRSIRDVYARDVEEILVDGEAAFKDAREFMRMLMPQHVRKIQLHQDGGLFARQGVEAQLDAMHSPTVQLRSGGYIVINQTEALVAIDVNSGRSTRERHIEDTALCTNLEAADEIARQLRLRDLAGLIVIDFIDMESNRNDAMVERRVKDALRLDRARIQVGHISHFGLLEMSRQRLRPSLTETTFVTCQHCLGRGQVRSIENGALQVLRAIEEEGARRRSGEIAVHVAASVALYLLNRKRDRLAQIEARYGMAVVFEPDNTLLPPALRIEKLRAFEPGKRPADVAPAALRMDFAPEAEEDETAEAPDVVEDAASEAAPRARSRDGRSREPRSARGRDAMPRDAAEQAPAEAGVSTGPAGPAAGLSEAEATEAKTGAHRKRRRRRRRPGTRPDGSPDLATAAEGDTEGEFAEDETAGEQIAGEQVADAPAARPADATEGDGEPGQALVNNQPAGAPEDAAGDAPGDGEGPRRRRRGRRGGSRTTAGPRADEGEDGVEPPRSPPRPAEPPRPRYTGPTPADPFAGQVDDILAAMDAAEVAAEAAVNRRSIPITAAPSPAAEPAPAAGEAVADQSSPSGFAADEAAPAAVAAPGPDASAQVAPEPAVAVEEPSPPRQDGQAAPSEHPEPAVVTGEPPDSPAPVAEPLQGAAIQPTVIAASDAAAPKRGGWWKR